MANRSTITPHLRTEGESLFAYYIQDIGISRTTPSITCPSSTPTLRHCQRSIRSYFSFFYLLRYQAVDEFGLNSPTPSSHTSSLPSSRLRRRADKGLAEGGERILQNYSRLSYQPSYLICLLHFNALLHALHVLHSSNIFRVFSVFPGSSAQSPDPLSTDTTALARSATASLRDRQGSRV